MKLEKLYDPENKLNRFCDLIIGVFLTGLFTFICSLPIVTISTAVTAGYYTTAKVVRHHEGYVWTEYFRSFGRNFKTAFPIGLGYLVAALMIVFDYLYLRERTDTTGTVLTTVIYVLALMLLLTFFFTFFELSRFDRSRFDSFKFGVITSFRHFPTAFAITLIFAVTIYLVYLMPWGFCLFPGFAFYASTFLMERIMRKYMPVPEEGSPEAEKWYYK